MRDDFWQFIALLLLIALLWGALWVYPVLR